MPRSSSPALELINPNTGDLEYPERFLEPQDWLLLAGETLAFLTGVSSTGREQAGGRSLQHSTISPLPSSAKQGQSLFAEEEPAGIQAAIHRVPWSFAAPPDGCALSTGAGAGRALADAAPPERPRVSMPFFLRARSNALLKSDAVPGEEMTCRELMERHCLGVRPWRLRGRNDW